MAPLEPACSSLLPLSSPHLRWLAAMYQIHLHIPPASGLEVGISDSILLSHREGGALYFNQA